MVLSIYLPLLFTAAFGLAAPGLARRLPPAVTTWLLSAGGLVAATGSSASLALLAFQYVAQAPILAARGRWSDTVLHHEDPVPAPIGLVAAVAVAVLTVRFTLAATRRLIAVRAAYRLAEGLPGAGSELSVLDTADPQAYAVPGRPGRIVVTTGLLRRLDADQRRALLAHERAHLLHRHHLHHTVTHLAAAVNPLLHRLPAAVELSCERWADEDAARVCRRDTVADALTHAATSGRSPAVAVVLAAAAADVADRIGALRAPAPRLALWRVALLLGLLAATAIAVAVAMHDTERLFELAQSAYRSGHQ
ncbi:MAG: M56 family metallopeptidase [Jatrophihabitantaceae bacterium]